MSRIVRCHKGGEKGRRENQGRKKEEHSGVMEQEPQQGSGNHEEFTEPRALLLSLVCGPTAFALPVNLLERPNFELHRGPTESESTF